MRSACACGAGADELGRRFPAPACAAPADACWRISRSRGWLPHAGMVAIAAAVVAGLVDQGGRRRPRHAAAPVSYGLEAGASTHWCVVSVDGARRRRARDVGARAIELAHASAFAGALYGLALALGLSLNLARAGTGGWWTVFATGRHGSFEGGFEYLPPLPLLSRGTGYYLSHFGVAVPVSDDARQGQSARVR